MDPKFLLQRKAMSLEGNGYRTILYFQKITISYASNRVLFGKEIGQLNVAMLSAFYKEPFYDGIQRFKRHASSAIHKNADVDLMHFKIIKIYHKDVPINQQLISSCWSTIQWKQNNRNGYEKISQPKIKYLFSMYWMFTLQQSLYNQIWYKLI